MTYIVYVCVACRESWDGRPYYHPCPHCKAQMGTVDMSHRALNIVAHKVEAAAAKIRNEIDRMALQYRINVSVLARLYMTGASRELAHSLTPSSGIDWPPWIRSPYRPTR